MRRTSQRSHLRKKQPNSYELLEPRQMLATLYVDFGFGMSGDFNITDAQSSQVNGPQIFGSGYSIGSFTQGVINDELDVNGDEVVDAADAQELASQVMEKLNRIFAPFDVVLNQAAASNFTSVEFSLGGPVGENTYIYVGGASPGTSSNFGDNGEALIDVNNEQDNLGFVFSHDFLTPGSATIEFAFSAIARSIAKQAGHTFGLQSVESGIIGDFALNLGGLDDPMATPGTRADGTFYYDRINRLTQAYFTNNDMPLAHVNGVSAGVQNSFALMESNVGLRGDFAYLTGNSNSNDFTITAVSPTVVDVTIDGQSFSNIDISNGLWIETGRDTDSVAIDGNITEMITINDPTSIELIGNPVVANITESFGGGNINGAVFFDSLTNLVTSELDDEITIQQDASIFEIQTRGGNDQVTLETDSRVTRLLLGDGDDHLFNSGGAIAAEFFGSTLDGGAGIDTWDFSLNQEHGLYYRFNGVSADGFSGTFFCHPHDDLCGTSYRLGMDRLIGSATHTNTADANFYNPDNKLTWIVDGETTTVTDVEYGQTLELIGFNELGGQSVPAYDYDGAPIPPRPLVDDFFVLATTRPTAIQDAGLIQISSTLDLSLGTTDTIDADISIGTDNLGMTYGEITTQVRISDRQGTEPMSALLGEADAWNILSGATDANVAFVSDMRILLTIDGTENHADIFEVNYNYFHVWFNGYGGDDLFFMGSTAKAADGELDFLRESVQINGGDGLDRVLLSNQGAEEAIDLRMTEKWLTPLNADDTEFVGVGLTNMEVVKFEGSEEAGHLRVFPSATTRFILDGNGPEGVDGDYLETKLHNATGETHRLTETGGTWNYADRMAIIHAGFEKLNNVNFVATSTLIGRVSEVRVYDHSGRFVRNFRPFTFRNREGVNTAFADVNHDGVPDLVVAPRGDFEPIVKVYDVASGSLLSSFTPYGMSYRGGIHLAVGNVTGDGATEIITSKKEGVPIVRVFSQEGSKIDYHLRSQHRPFGNTFSGGATIAAADMNWDGYADIISGAGKGELPQIAIHDVTNNDTDSSSVVQLNRFLVAGRGYRGGVNIATGNWLGNAKPDLFVGVGLDFIASSPLSGKIFVYRGESLYRNAPTAVLAPTRTLQAYEATTTNGVDLTTRDFDLDGKLDRVITSNTYGSSKIVKSYKLLDTLTLDRQFSEQENFGSFGGGVVVG